MKALGLFWTIGILTIVICLPLFLFASLSWEAFYQGFRYEYEGGQLVEDRGESYVYIVLTAIRVGLIISVIILSLCSYFTLKKRVDVRKEAKKLRKAPELEKYYERILSTASVIKSDEKSEEKEISTEEGVEILEKLPFEVETPIVLPIEEEVIKEVGVSANVSEEQLEEILQLEPPIIKCSFCGLEINGETVFCPQCGNLFKKE